MRAPVSHSQRRVLGFGLLLLASINSGSAHAGPPRNGLISYSVLTGDCDVGECTAAIRTIRPDGRGFRRLSCSSGPGGCYDRNPIFSPRGRLLATGTLGLFTGVFDDDPPDFIAIRTPDGRVRRRIPSRDKDGIEDLAWSADGARLAYNTGGGVFITRRDGSQNHLYRRTGGDDIAWSSRGQLACTHRRARGLWVTSRDRKRVRRKDVIAENPAWSPDGRWLAYNADSASPVKLIRPDGSGRRILTRRCSDLSSGTSSGLAWSPDGRRVLCTTGSSGDLIAVGVGSGKTRLVARRLSNAEITWQPKR